MRNVAFTVIFIALVLVASCGQSARSRVSAVLDDVEAYINERPDSALAVLEGVDSEALRTRALRARYALLHVMALDKCYADITDPGLLAPAVGWYEHHGSPDEKMKSLFYQGRIAQDRKDQNGAAVCYARAEEYADGVKDRHALALLYLAEASVYNTVFNVDKEEEHVGKALTMLRESDDPYYGAAVGHLALVYQTRREWRKADSLYQDALSKIGNHPHTTAILLSNYARMKLLQQEKDPAGALELLNRKRELSGGSLSSQEVGAYAYAAGLLGDKRTEEALVTRLESLTGESREKALMWLYRIALLHDSTDVALSLLQEARSLEDGTINDALSDSVSAALRSYSEQRAGEERNRRWREVLVLSLILLVTVLAATLSILHRRRVEAERDGLLRLSTSLEKEMKEAMEQNRQQVVRLEEREGELSERERKLDRLKQDYNRERMSRFRQAGNLGSIVLLKEKNRITEETAWRLLKRELVYIHHLDGNGSELIRRMDHELDGMISSLRKDLHLKGKPQEVLFLCCCILDMDAQVLADLTGKESLDAVYKKRSRLKAKVLALGKPEYQILFKEKKVN